MNSLTLLLTLFVVGCSAEYGYQYSNTRQDGSYSFGFNTGAVGGRHSRQESGFPDGTVSGSYSYSDPLGIRRSVQYRSGEDGYVASGHVGPVGSPKAHLPLYDVGYPNADSGPPQPESSTDPGESSTEAPDFSQLADTPKHEEGTLPPQDLGYFVLGLGGKRRLEKPSDTGRLDAPPESPVHKSPITLYSVVSIPYGYHGRRTVLIPAFPHIPFVPYYIPFVHRIQHPPNGYPSKSVFRTQ